MRLRRTTIIRALHIDDNVYGIFDNNDVARHYRALRGGWNLTDGSHEPTGNQTSVTTQSPFFNHPFYGRQHQLLQR